jgi:hypothetical protein
VGTAAAPSLGQLADRVDPPEVLATIRLDNDRCVKAGRLLILPQEELAAMAFECDFDEMRHIRSNEERRTSRACLVPH